MSESNSDNLTIRIRKTKKKRTRKRKLKDVEAGDGTLASLIRKRGRRRGNQLGEKHNSKSEKNSDDDKAEEEEEVDHKRQKEDDAPESIGEDLLDHSSFPVANDDVQKVVNVCRLCKKEFHDENALGIHQNVPHFWACTHEGCKLSFVTKDERAKHIECEHVVKQAKTSSSTGMDHLVLNADGTMSFNQLVSKNKRESGPRHDEVVDVSKLAMNSKYGGNTVNNGFINSASYRVYTKSAK